ncbi:unnamed protein product [Pipistrellus nathusii]|uniref:Uncharacterized protein n=1 Tax=Pipistrellus nathusii TaxID=59473 RepID=A0ABP0AE61_PIPNA
MENKFAKAAIKAVFWGTTTGMLGVPTRTLMLWCHLPLGASWAKTSTGVRVVVVTTEKIVHLFYGLDELSERGIEGDLMDFMKEK